MNTDYLFCFDVDGTLRDNIHHQVSPSTLKALQLLKKNQYRILICTGRGVDSLKKTGLMSLVPWDGYICNSGQVLLDDTGKTLQSYTMNPEVVKKTLEIAERLGYAVTLKSHPRIITKVDDLVIQARDYLGNTIPEVGVYTGQSVDAMCVFGPAGYDYHDFKGIEGVDIAPGMSSYSDFTIKGVTKGTGIDYFLNYYHTKQSVCFGDSLNDVEMFKHSTIKIAMGESDAKLKEMATYVTGNASENGIYDALNYYGFIKEYL